MTDEKFCIVLIQNDFLSPVAGNAIMGHNPSKMPSVSYLWAYGSLVWHAQCLLIKGGYQNML